MAMTEQSELTTLDKKLARVKAAKAAKPKKQGRPRKAVLQQNHGGGCFPRKVDRDELYAFLWRKADSSHRVRIHVSNLASALGVAPHTVSVIITKFCEDGRLLLVRREKSAIGVYQVTDPDTWNPKKPSTWTDGRKIREASSGPREIKWG